MDIKKIGKNEKRVCVPVYPQSASKSQGIPLIDRDYLELEKMEGVFSELGPHRHLHSNLSKSSAVGYSSNTGTWEVEAGGLGVAS